MASGMCKDVKDTIKAARLNEADLKPIVQPIFMPQIAESDTILMQMKPDMIEKISVGETLVIRGELTEPAVVCTKSSTYEIKEAKTSNSLLLLPDMQFPANCKKSGHLSEEDIFSQEVLGIFHGYYELKQCRPNLSKLKQLLKECQYYGKEYDEKSGDDLYTMQDLLNHVQASEDEIICELKKIHACDINGHIRMLDFDYKFKVVQDICDAIDSESIPFGEIPKNHIINLLKDMHPREILENCFRWFAYETPAVDKNGDNLYSLDEHGVCRIYAETMIRETTMCNFSDFMHAWSVGVPKGMKTSISQLEGLGIINLETCPEVICYFNVADLPFDIKGRFIRIFSKKIKWTYEEIEPYIRDLAYGNTDVKALLTKYTRSCTRNGKTFYTNRY